VGEAPPQDGLLERAHTDVIDCRAAPKPVEFAAQLPLEPGLAADLAEVLHVLDRNELRVDRHCAQCRVRRRLARGHLVDRQQLQHAVPRGREPAAHRLDIGDLANAPTARRRDREERDQDTRASSGR
jgi:hypothetical protein